MVWVISSLKNSINKNGNIHELSLYTSEPTFVVNKTILINEFWFQCFVDLIFFFFFFLFIGPNTKFCLQEAQVYENQRKIEGFISIFIEHILFTQPGFKAKLW